MAALILMYGSPALALTPRKQTVAPPGNSAVGEYVEDVPTAGGGRTVVSVHNPGGQTNALGAAVLRRFAAVGANGHRTALLAEATAPPSRPSHALAAIYSRLLKKLNAGVIGSLGRSLTGVDGGLGVLLPILLAASVIGVAAVALTRRRRPGS
jgi:hypothetical protein